MFVYILLIVFGWVKISYVLKQIFIQKYLGIPKFKLVTLSKNNWKSTRKLRINNSNLFQTSGSLKPDDKNTINIYI